MIDTLPPIKGYCKDCRFAESWNGSKVCFVCPKKCPTAVAAHEYCSQFEEREGAEK